MNTASVSIFFLVFCLYFLCISCRQSDTTEKTERIADLECRAIALREHRFALADSIRFTQDTLLHLKSGEDSIPLSQRLVVLNGEKNRLLQTSLQLADTIHLALDSLRKYTFKTADDRKEFDGRLKDLLRKKGCKTE